MASNTSVELLAIIPLVDLVVAHQLLDTTQRDDPEDLIVSLQRLLQANPTLEALFKPTLTTLRWDQANKHFIGVLTLAEKEALKSFFTKVLECSSEANTDCVMEEVTLHATRED